MRLPPRQSTAEADLMVPFQLVRFISSCLCKFYFSAHLFGPLSLLLCNVTSVLTALFSV